MVQENYRRKRVVGALTAGLLLGSGALLGSGLPGAQAADTGRQLVRRGVSTTTATVSGVRLGGLRADEGDSDAADAKGANRSLSTRGGRHTAGTTGLTVDNARPGLGTSFTGLDITDNAKAAGFVLEPPDQGLCVGNGSVLELVNVVGRVYTTAGKALGTGAFYLNDFFHEDPNSANASDPSCYYDADTNRFYADMLFYDSDPKTGEFTGRNRIDLAVSDTGNPGGSWKTYSFDVTADGPSKFNLGDYPQIGADREGIYITTNSYPFFEDGFGGAQLYALSKRGLAAGTDLRVSRVALPSVQGGKAFTLRPTTSPASSYARERNGTEYMLSSQAAEEAGNRRGFSQSIVLWALSNTDTLAPGATRALALRHDPITVDRYGVPPLSDQKAGPYPLGQCLSDDGCRQQVFGATSHGEAHAEGKLDSSDSRMHQTVYSKGLVYGALDTVVNVGGANRAGIAYYVVRPSTNRGRVLKGTIAHQGKLAVAGNNLIYPAFGVNPAGEAVLALNLVGRDHYPSAGYVTFDAAYRPSAVHVAGADRGPQDGFTEYPEFSASGVPRPRWGDYAATSFDPATGSIWMANEYIAQSCTLAQYQADPTCEGTRSRYGNWATRISQVNP